MFNMYSISQDASLWAKPDEFNPDHFLNESGALAKDRVEWILPFGAGKRRCIGEQLARMELFIFFATLLQKCSFSSVPGQELSIEPVMSFGNEAPAYEVIITPRDTF